MPRISRVLIVDDEPRICESLKFFLASPELNVTTVNSGPEALDRMNQTAFDLFLFDISMPEMDGFELMEQALRIQPDVPVIIITGRATAETAIKALKMGAYDFLTKPFEPEELIRNARNAIDQKRLKDDNKAITERLVKSEKRYRSMVQKSPDMIYTLDRAGNFVFVSDAVTVILGYQNQELVGRPYRSLIDHDGHLSEEELFTRSRTTRLRRKDGACCFVETSVSPVYDPEGRPIGCRGIDRDVTRRKCLEEALDRSNENLQNVRLSTILSLAKLAEYRDRDTGMHIERIREYTRIVADEMSRLTKFADYITPDYIADLYNSSILHDIGKVGIPDSILLKPARLTPDEFDIIKTHCTIGGEAIDSVIHTTPGGQSFLSLGREIVYHHHERWDGKGYPFGLAGEEIPLSARQVAIADVYDALTSKRVYKSAYDHNHAVQIIRDERGKHFDPAVVDAFLAREYDFRIIRLKYSERGRQSSRFREMPQEDCAGRKNDDLTPPIPGALIS